MTAPGDPSASAARPAGRFATAVERVTGVTLAGQLPVYLISMGHAGTHWITGTLYLLLPFVAADLGLSYTQSGALITVMTVASFVVSIGGGAIVDMTGRRIAILAMALGLSALGLLIVGIAEHVVWLIVAVALIGGNNNLWHPAAISFLSREYPENRGYALSIHGMGANLGDALAPLCTGALLTWLTWKSVGAANALPMFLIAAVIVMALSRIDPKTERAGARNVSGGDYVEGLKKLVKNRAVVGLCIMGGFRSMTQTGLTVYLPFYLKDVLGYGPFLMGLVIMGMQVGGIISSPVAGTLSDRIGRRPIVVGGLTASTLAIIGLTLASNEFLFVAGVAVLGFVLYGIRPVIQGWLMDMTPPELTGSATSLIFGTQAAFRVTVPVIGGLIADTWGLAAIFYMLAVTIIMANVVVRMLPKADAGR